MTALCLGLFGLFLLLSVFNLILLRYDKSPRAAFYAVLNRMPLRNQGIMGIMRSRTRSSNALEEYGRCLHHVPLLLFLETYEGSGQAVHPDVVLVAGGFGSAKWRYWMAVTPYPYGQDVFENPCIYASNDGVSWVIPDGLSNPIVNRPELQRCHHSDPSLIFWQGELWLYYRETRKRDGQEENRLFLTRSSDGVRWTTPVEVLSSTSDGLASPTVVFDGECLVMWTVDSLCWPCTLQRRSSADGVHWGESLETPAKGIGPGRCPWHLDVVADAEGFRALLVSCIGPGGQGARLHYSVSEDSGHSWLVRPFLLDQVHEFEQRLQYRAAIVRVPDIPELYEVWYSASDSNNVWSIAYLPMVELAGNLYPVGSMNWKTSLP